MVLAHRQAWPCSCEQLPAHKRHRRCQERHHRCQECHHRSGASAVSAASSREALARCLPSARWTPAPALPSRQHVGAYTTRTRNAFLLSLTLSTTQSFPSDADHTAAAVGVDRADDFATRAKGSILNGKVFIWVNMKKLIGGVRWLLKTEGHEQRTPQPIVAVQVACLQLRHAAAEHDLFAVRRNRPALLTPVPPPLGRR
mmetsp:Transcript_29428/g.59263  ORF Transcript_29428/g.59263 Transcript_29428/m.59263 type:complete len:200 (+) Transcript_29428:178-777(+)